MSILDISSRYRGGVVEKLADGDAFTCTVTSGGTVTGGRLAKFVSGDRQVDMCGANEVKVAGVALWTIAADATDRKVTVYTEGVFMLRASGAINAGDTVVPAAGGAVKAGDGTEDYRCVVGKAIANISNGADGPVLVDVP